MWLPFKTNLIRQEFGLLGSGTREEGEQKKNCLDKKHSEEERDGEDADVSRQEAVFIPPALLGKTGAADDGVPSNLPDRVTRRSPARCTASSLCAAN